VTRLLFGVVCRYSFERGGSLVYRPAVDLDLCFVLLPLRSPFVGYFEKIIKPAAAEAGLVAVKADDIYGTRAVISDIWEHIWKARAVVAIVTGKNPNVNYELGICHSLGIPTVLISEKKEDVPFDYRHRRYIPYRTQEADWQQKLTEDITKTLKAVLSSPSAAEELPWPYDTFDLSVSGRIGRLVRSEDARAYVVQGAELVSMSLAPAFGPSGSRVSVTMQELGRQMAFGSGARIAQRIKSGDPLKAQGVDQMARLSQEVLGSVGDATKTAVFLSAEMLKAGDAALKAGHNAKDVLSGMQRAVETANAYIRTEARPVAGEQLKGIALSASGFDGAIAAAVVEAFKKAGKDGIVQVVDGAGGELRLDVQEGMYFDRGFLSPLFVTDPERQECVLENCYVLVYERQIGSMYDFLPLLEKVARSGRPLLVISLDVAGEALATLIVNKQRGTLSCVAVKAPGSGDQRAAILQDISVLTGAKAFLEETGRPLGEIELSDLGRTQKVVVSKDSTTLLGGAGRPGEVAERIKQLRMQLSATTGPYDVEKIRERLAKLGGAIAVLRAPGLTDEDLADSRYKLESALHSCHSAIENGYVIGGGVSYCRARALVEKLVATNDSQMAGIAAVSVALVSPLKRLLGNSQHPDFEAVLKEVLESSSGRIGFNAESRQVEDLGAAGVLDSAKALSDTLALAFAYAEGILKTAAWDTTPLVGEESNSREIR
jgi:chaperonin GroEL